MLILRFLCTFSCILCFVLTCGLPQTALAATSPASFSPRDLWQRMPVPTAPRRILSLSPATTEILFAVGAQKEVVGVTHDCNYPPAAQRKTKVGRFGNILLEKILKTRPDLIVVTADMQSRLEPLRALSIPVLALDTKTLTDVMHNVSLLGALTGHAAQANGLVARWQRQMARLNPVKPAPSLFYMVWHDPLMTTSPQSFIGDLMQRAGGQNVIQQAGAPFLRYSTEKLLKANPEVLILPLSLSRQLQLQQPPFNALQAVKNQRVLVLDDDIISRPGPRVFSALHRIHHFLRKKAS